MSQVQLLHSLRIFYRLYNVDLPTLMNYLEIDIRVLFGFLADC